jgi:hypothetical protein
LKCTPLEKICQISLTGTEILPLRMTRRCPGGRGDLKKAAGVVLKEKGVGGRFSQRAAKDEKGRSGGLLEN